MANFLKYDPNSFTVPNRVVWYRQSEDGSEYAGDGTIIRNPDLTTVRQSGLPIERWKVDDGKIIPLTAQEISALDTAEASSRANEALTSRRAAIESIRNNEAMIILVRAIVRAIRAAEGQQVTENQIVQGVRDAIENLKNQIS